MNTKIYLPSQENFTALCTIMYEFTGLDYWIIRPALPKLNFVQEFHEVLNEVRVLVERGEVCKYNFIRLSDHHPVPFSINQYQLYP